MNICVHAYKSKTEAGFTYALSLASSFGSLHGPSRFLDKYRSLKSLLFRILYVVKKPFKVSLRGSGFDH
jgi:hypothetical protein